jgi:hypothetical protein
MALNPDIVEDVANSNFKVVANAAATGVAQAMAVAAQNLTTHQQMIQAIQAHGLAEALGQRAGMDIGEGLGVTAMQRGDFGKSSLEAAVVAALASIVSKNAGNTPPVTP